MYTLRIDDCQFPTYTEISDYQGMDKNDRLRWARERAGFTSAAEAARALGVTIPTYAAHENSGRDFRDESALKYARRFKVPVEWLVFGIGDTKSNNLPESEPQSAVIDDSLLGKIIKAIEEVIKEDGLTISPAKKGEHAAKLYKKATSICKPNLRDDKTLKSFVQDELLNKSSLP